MRNQAQKYKALAAKQSLGLFLPNASHLEPRVASSNLANKQKRKQDIPAAPPAERSNRSQKYKALAAKQSPGLFLPNATHLEPRVASSNLENKQKRKQDIPAAPPAEMSNRAQRYKALAAKQSPGLFLPNAAHLEPRVANSNLVNKQKRKQDIPATPPAERSNRAQRYKALAAKQSPGLFLPNAAHLEPRVASSNLVNKQKRKQDILKNVLLPFGRGDKI